MKNDRKISILHQGSKFLLWKKDLPKTENKFSMLKVLKKYQQTWPINASRYSAFLALGTDVLTPWHQKLNWPFWHLSHAIYSPACLKILSKKSEKKFEKNGKKMSIFFLKNKRQIRQIFFQVLPTLATPPDIALIVRRAGVTSIVASILATKNKTKM